MVPLLYDKPLAAEILLAELITKILLGAIEFIVISDETNLVTANVPAHVKLGSTPLPKPIEVAFKAIVGELIVSPEDVNVDMFPFKAIVGELIVSPEVVMVDDDEENCILLLSYPKEVFPSF